MGFWLSVHPTIRLSVAILVAACQPQARRLLLLDLALSDPLALDATAQPWHDAGYTVEYRRFYPHLTRADLARYRTLLLLGGRAPERASDALTAGDLALLSEWVDGGVVVLGYPADAEGSLDRWLMNRWLAWKGAGITIGDDVLRDTAPPQSAQGAFDPQPPAEPQRNLPLQDPGFNLFPAGYNYALLAASDEQVLARTTRTAFVRPPGQKPAARHRAAVIAASRVGNGLVIVVSRHALSALGTDSRPSTTPTLRLDDLAATREFLVSLARWTRRPAEWARIPPRRARHALALSDAPRAVALAPPLLAPPGRTAVSMLPTPTQPGHERPQKPPDWVGRAGQRIAWGRLAALAPAIYGAPRQRALDSLVAFLETGGFNAYAGDALAATLADTIHSAPWEREAVRNAWKQLGDALAATSVRWIPAVEPAEFRVPVDTALRQRATAGGGGDTLSAWCPLDPVFWADGMAASYRVLARLAATRVDLIPAIALDLDPAPLPLARRPSDDPFCDAAWRAGLAALPHDSVLPPARAERFAALPPAARYDSLLASGLLGDYYAALEKAVAERATALRAELRRIRPDLGFAFVTRRPPVDWYALGLLRGFSAPDMPVLLWSPEVRPRDLLQRARGRGIAAVPAVGLAPGGIPAGAWPRLGKVAFVENDGFWIGPLQALLSAPRAAEGPLSPDSLARVIRRLTPRLP